MKVLVTGASGFVAGHLIPRLFQKIKEDVTVTAFIRRRSDSRISPLLIEMKNLYQEKLNIMRGDITNYQDVRDALYINFPDIIFHLASQSFVPDSVSNPVYTHDVNAGGVLNILETVRNYNNEIRILYTSSSEVYGYQDIWNLPLNEQSYPNPQSPYASAKLYGEWLCRNYHKSYGIPVVISRAFNHEGPNRGHHFVTASIVRQLVAVKKKETDRIYVGNLDVTRDWSHVSDIVNGYILLAEKGEPGQTYVLGSGKQTSLTEFISRTAMLLSLDNFRVFQDDLLVRNVDVPRLQSDSSKIRELGWEPTHNIDDIITQMIAFYMGMSKKERWVLEPEHKSTYELQYVPVEIDGKYTFNLDATVIKERRIK